MNYKTTILAISSLILLGGCSDSKTDSAQTAQIKEPLKIIHSTPVKAAESPSATKEYSIAEVYDAMCIICHSSDGSGNTEKLTPSMKHLTQAEMLSALKEVEADQGHIIMEHNRGEILKMGMEYQADDMAAYMFQRFNK